MAERGVLVRVPAAVARATAPVPSVTISKTGGAAARPSGGGAAAVAVTPGVLESRTEPVDDIVERVIRRLQDPRLRPVERFIAGGTVASAGADVTGQSPAAWFFIGGSLVVARDRMRRDRR